MKIMIMAAAVALVASKRVGGRDVKRHGQEHRSTEWYGYHSAGDRYQGRREL